MEVLHQLNCSFHPLTWCLDRNMPTIMQRETMPTSGLTALHPIKIKPQSGGIPFAKCPKCSDLQSNWHDSSKSQKSQDALRKRCRDFEDALSLSLSLFLLLFFGQLSNSRLLSPLHWAARPDHRLCCLFEGNAKGKSASILSLKSPGLVDETGPGLVTTAVIYSFFSVGD